MNTNIFSQSYSNVGYFTREIFCILCFSQRSAEKYLKYLVLQLCCSLKKTNLHVRLWVLITDLATVFWSQVTVPVKCCFFKAVFLVYIQWDLVTWCLMYSVSSLSSVDKWYPLGSTASKAFRPLAGQMSSYQLTSGLSHRQTDRWT